MNVDRLAYDLKEQDQLCFLRLHKTASTTLDGILAHQFAAEQIFPLTANFSHYSPLHLQSYRLFRGHFDYDTYQQYVQRPIYITLLRHPIERVISLYKHALCIPDPAPTPEEQVLKELAQNGLLQFVTADHVVIRMLTVNAQVRQLAGTLYDDPVSVDPTDLERAKTHLDDTVFFGITEQFQDSIGLMNYVFGWYPTVHYRNLRVSPQAQQAIAPDPEAIAAIQERVPLDMDLYHYAKIQFNHCFHQMVEELQPLKTRSPATDSLTSLLDYHYQQRCRHRLQGSSDNSDRLDFYFNQPIPGSGWHQRTVFHLTPEQPASYYFCWTGPDTITTLDLPPVTAASLAIRSLLIRLHLVNYAALDVLHSLTVAINHTPIALQPIQHQGRRAIVEGTIPPDAIAKAAFLRLTIEVNRTMPLCDVNPARQDDRPVGLAFYRIEVVQH